MRHYLVVIELEADDDERAESIAAALVGQVDDGEVIAIRPLHNS